MGVLGSGRMHRSCRGSLRLIIHPLSPGLLPVGKFNILPYFLTNFVLLLAWEFIFRGYLLFGLAKKFGEASVLIQMVPFVLLHIGKPGLETLSTIITGILFGYIAYRGKSYWPAFIIHLFINVFFVLLVNS